MGIKHLNQFLTEKCDNHAIKKMHLSKFSGKRIAVDASIYLYRFMGENRFIEYMYLMISIFKEYDIDPIFIFDGASPPEKKELLDERRKNKKFAEDYMVTFGKFWKSPDFETKYRQAVYKTCNAMLQRKLKPYPNFINYLNAVSNCIITKQDQSVFINWQSCIEKIFASKNLKSIVLYCNILDILHIIGYYIR